MKIGRAPGDFLELEQLEEMVSTEIWERYAAKLRDMRAGFSRQCETTEGRELQQAQGAIQALDAVMRLPKIIATEIRTKGRRA